MFEECSAAGLDSMHRANISEKKAHRSEVTNTARIDVDEMRSDEEFGTVVYEPLVATNTSEELNRKL